jgi:hypothetical protein
MDTWQFCPDHQRNFLKMRNEETIFSDPDEQQRQMAILFLLLLILLVGIAITIALLVRLGQSVPLKTSQTFDLWGGP